MAENKITDVDVNKITITRGQVGEYPPGWEVRKAIRKCIEILGNADIQANRWMQLKGIEPSIVNLARSAAQYQTRYWGDEWQLVTRYDAKTKILWLSKKKMDIDIK